MKINLKTDCGNKNKTGVSHDTISDGILRTWNRPSSTELVKIYSTQLIQWWPYKGHMITEVGTKTSTHSFHLKSSRSIKAGLRCLVI